MTTSTPRAPTAGSSSGTPVAADPAILHRNLGAIARRDSGLAAAIAAAGPHPDALFTSAPDGAVTATLAGRALASQRAPLEEASRLADTVTLETTGGIILLGFGLGHHAAELARRARTCSALVIFEPDIPLLRAVLERIDHSAWLGETAWAFATNPEDAVALSHALRGLEAPLGVGTAILEHPPSRMRLRESGPRFASTFARTFAAMRTHIITTMMQTDVTVRNELMNVAHYVRRPGIDDLAGIAAGRPAIVVSAGPSLRRNVELLRTPGLRDRCVIIAVQTVLKHLLAMGIRPHFVTAIDYHEISRRFYEGLTPEAVEGVTLVVEPRANAAILDAFPGAMRLPGDELLDTVLDRSGGARARLTPAATVAHQAYYLARFMGADPVILIGQDLAFTDGQYYAPRAAIHDTWAPELNPFTSLERLEWERIARTRGTLIEATDHLGRRVYTDEQMATYLAQFERDFAGDAGRGLITIDATEGGVHKAHAIAMPLGEALDRFAHPHVEPLPTLSSGAVGIDEPGEAAIRARIRSIARDVRRIARDSRSTIALLNKLPHTLHDRGRANRIIAQIEAIRDELHGLEPAFGIVMRLNQTGAFKRFKADRLIRLAQHLAPQDVQRRQIERDITNVEWIRDMADLLAELLEESERTFEGGPKRTHDAAPPSLDADTTGARPRVTTGAIVVAPSAAAAARGFLGEPALAHTLARVSRCAGVSSVIILTDDPEVLAPIAARSGGVLPIRVERMPAPDARRARSIGAARAWSGASWRGGVASMTVFDEVFDPAPLAEIVTREGWDAAMILGADWVAVDPDLCDRLITRHAESPEANPFTFCQAPPGMAPCVASRAFLGELASCAAQHPLYATIASALGYVPLRPRSDPIAKPSCIQIDSEVRSTVVRCIPDTVDSRIRMERTLANAGGPIGARELARRLGEDIASHAPLAPGAITIELTTARPWRTFPGIDPSVRWDRGAIPTERAIALLRALGAAFPATPITFGGFGEPLSHPDWPAIIRAAREAGLGPIHVRTSLAGDIHHEAEVIGAEMDVVSIDLLANQEATYARLTGTDAYAQVITRLDGMIRARTPGLPHPWIVPRITRCDAVYDEIEVFFDKWTILTGAAAIDPLRLSIPDDRIEPLPVPAIARASPSRATLPIRADLSIPENALDPASSAFTMLDPTDPGRGWRTVSGARHGAISGGDWSNLLLNSDD